jgi:D-threonate/D-erythronate kinase
MQLLRLLADDLTGALDTSAELVGAFGPLDVVWSKDSTPAGQGSFAIETGTRELGSEQAFAIIQERVPLLHGATIAYKKIDSLLRGPWAAELDACLRSGFWDACIVAPAFAYQGRRTRLGRQYAIAPDGSWRAVGASILEQLRQQNIEVQFGRVDSELQPGVSVFDADADEDLERVVQIGRRYSGRVLWCGSGGLASALASQTGVRVSRKLQTPVLGVFGSDHPATDAQLARCRNEVVPAADGHVNLHQIKRRLARGVAFVRLEAPHGHSRAEAAQRFEREIAALSNAIDPPGTLIIAGGETLKAQCLAVGASALKVLGRLEPGLPRSVIQGGPWMGVDVISKSGAFGPRDLWWNLLNENGLIQEEEA